MNSRRTAGALALLLALVAQPLRANEAGYYSAERLWELSSLFGRSTTDLAGPWQTLQSQVRRADLALAHSQLALEGVGSLVSEEERASGEALLAGRRQAFDAGFREAQAFADQISLRYEEVLRPSADRAAGAVAEEAGLAELPECSAQGIAAIMGADAGCAGQDHSEAVAQQIDRDEELSSALDALSGEAWPDVLLEPAPAAPLGGEQGYLDMAHLLGEVDATSAAERRLDRAVRQRLAAIERGWARADEAERARLATEMSGVEAWRAERRAELGALLEARRSQLGGPERAWCVQAELLGACAGEDHSAEAVERLAGDRRLERQVARWEGRLPPLP